MPVRPAFVGLTIGIAGVLAAGVIAVSFHELSRATRPLGVDLVDHARPFAESPPIEDLVDDPRVESAGMCR